jgi:hypothetical protein
MSTARAAGGTIVIVQAVQATAASDTTLNATLAATGTGNCLVVCSGSTDITTNPGISSVTLGGAADNWAAANTAHNNADCNVDQWIDPNCAGGQTAVVITYTGGSGGTAGVAAWVFEVAGLAASPLDKHPAGSNGIGTTWSSGSTGTLGQANEIAFGVVGCIAGAPVTITGPGAPWTEESQINVTGAVSVVAGYQIVSATTALTYNGSNSPSSGFGTCVITLKAGPVTPAVTGGLATISVGPQGFGNVWYPASATILTTSGVNDNSTCSIYLGPAGIPVALQATIFPGGIGTASLAIPSMTPGQYIIAQWTGGNGGDVATLNVIGTMDSVSP